LIPPKGGTTNGLRVDSKKICAYHRAMRIYDITVPIQARTPVFPGDPGVEIETVLALQRGDAANVSLLRFGAHTATHVDAPVHFIEGGSTVAEMPLDALIGSARVIELPDEQDAVRPEDVTPNKLQGARRVLFKTRNSAFWGEIDKGFRQDFAYITPAAAQALADAGVRLVGIDYLSVEKFGAATFDTHTALLSRGVVILEGLDLRAVGAGLYELLCLPLKLASGCGDGAPARAVLRDL
jgi:arylformamidase